MEPVTSTSLVQTILGWFSNLLPWGLGGAAVAAGVNYFGGDLDKLIDKLPKPLADGLKWASDLINRIFSYGKETVRGFLDKESSTAQRDYESAIDSYEAITRIDQTFGLSGASAHIRELAKKASGDIFGFTMARDGASALASSTKLHEEITTYLVERLKDKNPNHGKSDVEKYQAAASSAASYITGVTSETGDNPNLLTQGLGGALVRLQTEVKKDGDYRTGQTPAGTVDESLLAQVRGLLTGQVAPASDAATNITPGKTTPAQVTR